MIGILLTEGESGRDTVPWSIGLGGIKGIRKSIEELDVPWEEYFQGGGVIAIDIAEGERAGRYLFWPEDDMEKLASIENVRDLRFLPELDLNQWVSCPGHRGFWTYQGCPGCERDAKEAKLTKNLKPIIHKIKCPAHLLFFETRSGCGLCSRGEKVG